MPTNFRRSQPQPVEILTGDLLLRPWLPTDAGAVYRACQDPEIQRWTRVPSPYRPEHADQFVNELSPQAWASDSGAPLGVFDAASGELLGSNGLVTISGDTAELGYWTAPWARGRGVAQAGARAVATLAFDAFGLRRLTWCAKVGNHASRLIALRAGFRVQGTTRIQEQDDLPFDIWQGTMFPAELTLATPARYATGSLLARQAAVFGHRQPSLSPADRPELRLRPPTGADLEPAMAACQDAESIRWTTVPVPYTRADAESYLLRHAPRCWAAGEAAIFTLADRDDAYQGALSLRLAPDDPAVAEVGFLVAPWARGRGLATAAVRAVTSWSFAELGLTRLVWRAHLGNHASRRVAEKAGFRIEGITRAGSEQRGARLDAWVGGLLATDQPGPAASWEHP